MKVIFIDNPHHEHFTFFSEEDVIFFKFLAKQKPHYIHIYASEVICIFELYLKKKNHLASFWYQFCCSIMNRTKDMSNLQYVLSN